MLNGGQVWALGAMSGTSLDGIDAALILTDGQRVLERGDSRYRPYSPDERAVLAAGLGHWEGPAVEAAAALVTRAHAELLAQFPQAQLVGFHGQTLAHDPPGRGTLQVGDGAALARTLGRPVIWDFRSADVAAGGQGAPLAPFYHFALARAAGAQLPLAMLNLGGVGNLTWIDPRHSAPEADGALLAFDTGPANAPINDFMQRRLGLEYDAGGACAAQGQADSDILAQFAAHPFFAQLPPKSLDRDAFADLTRRVDNLPEADAVATLTALVAQAVGAGLGHCPIAPSRLLVTGGGRLNTTLMAMISRAAGLPAEPIEAIGCDGDMLEAEAFAFLAVRVARGLPTSAAGTTGARFAVRGGRRSDP